jgi:hypothetical protein
MTHLDFYTDGLTNIQGLSKSSYHWWTLSLSNLILHIVNTRWGHNNAAFCKSIETLQVFRHQ